MPIYMKFDGIDGDVTARGYEGWHEAMSWSWGETNQGSHVGGGGGGAGKVAMQDFHFVKQSTKGSPQLMHYCASGRHLPAVQFVHTIATQDREVPYQRWTLENVMITSYGPGGDSHSLPMESLSLNFAKIKFEQAIVDADGSVRYYQVATWDVARGQGTIQP